MHGDACDRPGQIAFDSGGSPLVCEATADTPGAWKQPGVDFPVTTPGVPNARCDAVGELARSADGSLLRCVWNNHDRALGRGPGVNHE